MFLARSVLVVACASLLAPLALSQVGSVVRTLKIDDAHGGFSGTLEDEGYFGQTLARVGDLDGDGIPELAVGAPYASGGGIERGEVWILFLAPDGSVRRETRIAQGAGGFDDTLVDHTLFGYALAELGDLDGDGVPELAVGAHGTPNTPWPGGIWILFLTSSGKVRAATRIDGTDPVFVPRLRADYAYSLANLGDVDGDGVPDLAMGTPYDDDGTGNDGGALWILRLQADGRAKAATKISQTRGGFPGRTFILGGSLASLGDLDGDGQPELAAASAWPLPLGSIWVLALLPDHTVGAATQLFPPDLGRANEHFYYVGAGDLDQDGRRELFTASAGLDGSGGITVNFVADDGRPGKQVALSRAVPGLAALGEAVRFGMATVLLGDLDKDGTLELAMGASLDSETGEERGAVWIVSLVAERSRNAPGNLDGVLEQKHDPVLGAPWRIGLDCSALGAGLAHLLVGDRASEGPRTRAGTWLVAGGSHRLLTLTRAHAGQEVDFEVQIPVDPALIGRALHAQGLCDSTRRRQLTNALDVLVGRF